MRIEIGTTKVTNIVEQPLTFLSLLIPDATSEAVADLNWLRPHFVDDEERLLGDVQTFVVEHDGALIVVDTCVGDGKRIPHIPPWNELSSGYLDRFELAGFAPADVDIVLCTHMHMDHVGWHTTPDGRGGFSPTFPNARHLFARTEFEHFMAEADAARGERSSEDRVEACVLRESIEPIMEAGLHELIDVPCDVLPGITLFPTPGHTPGHVSVEISSGDRRAVITGDAFHHPCQIARPEWFSTPDVDRERATQSRHEILTRCHSTGATLIGTHFAEPCHGVVEHDDGAFRLAVTPGADIAAKEPS